MSKSYSGITETSPYLLRKPRALREVLAIRERRAQARKNTPQVTPGGIVVPLRPIQKKHVHLTENETAEEISAEVLARFRHATEDSMASPRKTADSVETLDRFDIVRRLDKFAVLLRGVGSVGLAQRIERRAMDIRNLEINSGDSDN